MADERPLVRARCGPVMGRTSGRLRIFRGIPFAEPPAGVLRFRPPVAKAPWRDVLDAGAFGPAPLQPETPMLHIGGPVAEDCLTLNVWAPLDGGPYPVVFSIFGGGNFLGSSSQPEYNGAAFAEKGIVFVSANYRLGALGFMELGALDESLAGSGLNGLRDILAGLRWVRDNIEAFGGDPEQVTLLGISAGGKNQCALAAMPASRGLFRRMTVMSGGGHTVFASAEEAAPVAKGMLAALGAAPNDIQALINAPSDAILEAQSHLLASFERGFPFRPTVDGEELPCAPIDAARKGRTVGLDLIMGSTCDEAALGLAFGHMDAAIRARQLANLDISAIPSIEERYANLLPDLSAVERKFRILTAEEYWIPSIRFAEAHARAGGRVRMYRFDWEAKEGPFAGYAIHGADSPFVYGGESYMGIPLSAEQRAAAGRVHEMWAEWVKTKTPVLRGAPEWPLYDEAQRLTLLLKDEPVIAPDPRGAERQIWSGIL